MILTNLKTEQKSEHKIEDFGISASSLEEVFISVERGSDTFASKYVAVLTSFKFFSISI